MFRGFDPRVQKAFANDPRVLDMSLSFLSAEVVIYRKKCSTSIGIN